MSKSLHPAATHHIPAFITAPGETDVLLVVMAAVLLLAILGFGVLFLRLHSLPEQMAHRSHKLQFELVAVLCLISLFTHQHIFWIAGLLLAMVDLPDFGTPLNRIAGSAEKLAGIKPGEIAAPPVAAARPDEHEGDVPVIARGEGSVVTLSPKPEVGAQNAKELSHA
jgi:hypothetical protein